MDPTSTAPATTINYHCLNYYRLNYNHNSSISLAVSFVLRKVNLVLTFMLV